MQKSKVRSEGFLKSSGSSRELAIHVGFPCSISLNVCIIFKQKRLENRVRPSIRRPFEWLLLQKLPVTFLLPWSIMHVKDIAQGSTTLNYPSRAGFADYFIDYEKIWKLGPFL